MNLNRNRTITATLSILVLAFSLVTLPANADTCQWEPHYTSQGQLYYVQVCYPEYYVWQYTEPNWCLYNYGDELQVQWGIVNGYMQIVGWYVTDTNGTLGGQYADAIVNGNCGYVWYPW